MKGSIARTILVAVLLTTVYAVIQASVPKGNCYDTGYALAMSGKERLLLRTETRLSALSLQTDQRRGKQRAKEEITPSSLLQAPVECDTALSYLDHALAEAFELKDAHLIVVARVGTGERLRVNRERLSGIEEYMKRKFPSLKYVMAEGSKVNGLGRVELYVGGRLLYAMSIKKNARGFCDEPIRS